MIAERKKIMENRKKIHGTVEYRIAFSVYILGCNKKNLVSNDIMNQHVDDLNAFLSYKMQVLAYISYTDYRISGHPWRIADEKITLRLWQMTKVKR